MIEKLVIVFFEQNDNNTMRKFIMPDSNKQEKSQFGLLADRRFAPFFWTQFFGAFNDNVFKNAFILLITYTTSQTLAGKSDILVNIAAGLFILPFFLFSATAGQIADKYEKSFLIRRIKILEIVINVLAWDCSIPCSFTRNNGSME